MTRATTSGVSRAIATAASGSFLATAIATATSSTTAATARAAIGNSRAARIAEIGRMTPATPAAAPSMCAAPLPREPAVARRSPARPISASGSTAAQPNGLIISDISSSGPITRFGFREGDRIISVNGTRVSSEQQFIEYLLSPRYANQRVQVVVWRNNQQVPIWVEPWVLVQEDSSSTAQVDPLETYGVILDDRYQYPVVWKVLPRTPAYYAGIRAGDVIVAWSGQHVSDPAGSDRPRRAEPRRARSPCK